MFFKQLHRLLCSIVCLLAITFSPLSNAAPPFTPENFRYEVYSNSAAEIFWLRTTNVSVEGYELTRNGEDLGVIDALSYFDDTLMPGVEYTYTIKALGFNGERSGAAVVTLRTPQDANTIATLEQEIAALQQEITSLESLLDEGIRSPVPKTGQTASELFGDDGDFQAGIDWPESRFTINVNEEDDLNDNSVCDDNEICNGTVTDNLTSLVWLQNANCYGARSWADGIDDANNLEGDGTSGCGLNDNSQQGDWRMPNVKEIQSLMDYGHAFPTLLLPEGHPFVDVQAGGIDDRPSSYWTSTSIGPASSGVYSVSLSVGWVERLSLSGNFNWYVWPVKGGVF